MNIKRSVFWVLMGVPVLTFAQQNYTVKVDVKNLENPGKAYISYQLKGNPAMDSASLIGGTYVFKGVISEPALGQLFIRKNEETGRKANLFGTAVWLEKGNVKVSADSPLSKPVIAGGVLNVDYQMLLASKEPERVKMEVASKRFMEATEEAKKAPDFMKNHMAAMKEAMKESAVKDSVYINTHPNSYLSLYLVSTTTSFAPISVLEKRYKTFPKTLQTTYLGKELLSTIDLLKSREIGGKASDFTLDDSFGKPISLSSFRGKYVLLDFWASWCVPCRKENPIVKSAYEHFRDKKFTVVSVSIDAPSAKAKWLEAIEKDQLHWTQLCDTQGGGNQAAMLYNVMSIPQNFLIDPSGKIIAKNLRGPELEKALTKLVH